MAYDETKISQNEESQIDEPPFPERNRRKQTKNALFKRGGALRWGPINKLQEQKMKEYLARKSDVEEMFPAKITAVGYCLDREALCDEIFAYTGIEIKFGFIQKGGFAEKIQALLAAQLERQGKSWLTAKELHSALAAEKERQRRSATTLEFWLEELKKSGGKLRADKNGRGLDYSWISRQTGISRSHLRHNGAPCAEIIKKAKRTIGYEQFPDMEAVGIERKFTYLELLEHGTARRRAEVSDQRNAKVQINNSRHCLLKHLALQGLALESVIGPEFGVLFMESLTESVGKIPNDGTRKKLVCELKRWQKYYRSLLQTGDLPPTFGDALNFLFKRSGCGFAEVGRLLPRNQASAIASWANGLRTPSICSLPSIYKIEEYFNLPRNTLVGRVIFDGRSGIKAALERGGFPRPVGESFSLLASYLPSDFPTLPIEEQQSLVTAANEHILQNKSEFRLWSITMLKKSFSLKIESLTPRTRQEIDELISYKTAIIPPTHYRRGDNGQWRKPTPDCPGTVGIFKYCAGRIFGVLTVPKENMGGGLRINQLTLAHFVLPSVWRLYFDYVEKRNGKLPVTSIYPELAMVYPWLDAKYGWITQSAWLAERLEPIDGIITEQEVSLAKTNWREFIRKNESELDDIRRYLKKIWEVTPPDRDSHLPILPILESDEPLKILYHAIREYESQTRYRTTAPVMSALDLRNVVLLRILAETALRSRNLIDLTWKPNNTGQLRRETNGYYMIEIPYTQFKNPQSRFFGPPRSKQNYKITLSKKLIPLLDRYLHSARALLLNCWAANNGIDEPVDEGFLFVSRAQCISQHLSVVTARGIMRRFTATYLVYNPLTGTGIKGVEPFLLHAVRHIVATYILKKTGSYFEAGRAIQDTAYTAERHYARYAPEDLDKRFRHYITGIMDADDDE